MEVVRKLISRLLAAGGLMGCLLAPVPSPAQVGPVSPFAVSVQATGSQSVSNGSSTNYVLVSTKTLVLGKSPGKDWLVTVWASGTAASLGVLYLCMSSVVLTPAMVLSYSVSQPTGATCYQALTKQFAGGSPSNANAVMSALLEVPSNTNLDLSLYVGTPTSVATSMFIQGYYIAIPH